MTVTATSASVRVTVRGAAGAVDLVVPLAARVDVVAREYAEALGLDDAPGLASVAGEVLSPEQTIHALGLRHGAVLAALDDASEPCGEVGDASSSTTREPAGVGMVLVALGAGLLAAVAATYAGDWRLRASAAVVLLLGAGLALVPQGPALRVTRVAAPGLAAAGGFTGLYDASTGGLFLAMAVAGLTAGAAAALGRTDRDPGLDGVLRVWLGAAVTVTVVAALLLLVGAGDHALWAVLLAAAMLVAKLLPGSVVDVPDHLLLDLERLAVTAWTARDRPTGGRRRRMAVRSGSVVDVVHRGHRLIAAVTVAVAVTASVSAPLLLTVAESGTVTLGSRAEVFLAGASLALMSRSYRARLPRLALRVSGAWCLALIPLSLVLGLDETWIFTVVGVGAVVASMVLVVAVAMGNGWRSVWWARVGEILEELCVALCLAVLPVAAGLFGFVRQLTS